jgi:Zn-dependent protease with chaperone function/signal transduction histidine kinase/membrane protease YdiL (CAAX protease family)/serine/threonine protein kinase/tRNA1(Val) A37 N6-methylase TrmN6
MDIEEAFPLFVKLCELVGFIHSKGIIIRELKPGNIMLLSDNDIALYDFNVSMASDYDWDSDPLELKDTVRHDFADDGWEYFTRPRARIKPDIQSDIFTIGMDLFVALTGEIYYQGPYREKIGIERVHNKEARDVIARAIGPRQTRYRNVTELMADLINVQHRIFEAAVSSSLAPAAEVQLNGYLKSLGNFDQDIAKAIALFEDSRINKRLLWLEIGCGLGDTSFELEKYFGYNFIATDIFAFSGKEGAYMDYSLKWADRSLDAQMDSSENKVVVLRTGPEIIKYLPAGSIDVLFTIYPPEYLLNLLFQLLGNDLVKERFKKDSEVLIKPIAPIEFYDFLPAAKLSSPRTIIPLDIVNATSEHFSNCDFVSFAPAASSLSQKSGDKNKTAFPKELILMTSETYPLYVPQEAHAQAIQKYGEKWLSLQIKETVFLNITPEEFAGEREEIQKIIKKIFSKRHYEELLGRLELIVFIVTNKESLLDDRENRIRVASVNAFSTKDELGFNNTIYLHPYFFSLPEIVREDILGQTLSALEHPSWPAWYASARYFYDNPLSLNKFMKTVSKSKLFLDGTYTRVLGSIQLDNAMNNKLKPKKQAVLLAALFIIVLFQANILGVLWNAIKLSVYLVPSILIYKSLVALIFYPWEKTSKEEKMIKSDLVSLARNKRRSSSMFWAFMNMVVYAPTFEEILNRWILFNAAFLLLTYAGFGYISATAAGWASVILSGVFFGLLHYKGYYVWSKVFGTSISGIIFGYYYWQTQSLITTLVIHGLINSVGFLLMLALFIAYRSKAAKAAISKNDSRGNDEKKNGDGSDFDRSASPIANGKLLQLHKFYIKRNIPSSVEAVPAEIVIMRGSNLKLFKDWDGFGHWFPRIKGTSKDLNRITLGLVTKIENLSFNGYKRYEQEHDFVFGRRQLQALIGLSRVRFRMPEDYFLINDLYSAPWNMKKGSWNKAFSGAVANLVYYVIKDSLSKQEYPYRPLLIDIESCLGRKVPYLQSLGLGLSDYGGPWEDYDEIMSIVGSYECRGRDGLLEWCKAFESAQKKLSDGCASSLRVEEIYNEIAGSFKGQELLEFKHLPFKWQKNFVLAFRLLGEEECRVKIWENIRFTSYLLAGGRKLEGAKIIQSVEQVDNALALYFSQGLGLPYVSIKDRILVNDKFFPAVLDLHRETKIIINRIDEFFIPTVAHESFHLNSAGFPARILDEDFTNLFVVRLLSWARDHIRQLGAGNAVVQYAALHISRPQVLRCAMALMKLFDGRDISKAFFTGNYSARLKNVFTDALWLDLLWLEEYEPDQARLAEKTVTLIRNSASAPVFDLSKTFEQANILRLPSGLLFGTAGGDWYQKINTRGRKSVFMIPNTGKRALYVFSSKRSRRYEFQVIKHWFPKEGVLETTILRLPRSRVYSSWLYKIPEFINYLKSRIAFVIDMCSLGGFFSNTYVVSRSVATGCLDELLDRRIRQGKRVTYFGKMGEIEHDGEVYTKFVTTSKNSEKSFPRKTSDILKYLNEPWNFKLNIGPSAPEVISGLWAYLYSNLFSGRLDIIYLMLKYFTIYPKYLRQADLADIKDFERYITTLWAPRSAQKTIYEGILSAFCEISSRAASALVKSIEDNIIDNRLLSLAIVFGNKILRGYVNPLSREHIVASGWGGIDIVNLWLATHFGKAYIINDFAVNVGKLRFYHDTWASFDKNLEYLIHKFDLGYNYTEDFHPVFGKEPEFFIIQELQGMGIGKEQIRIEEDSNKRAVLSFVPSGIHKESRIIFVKDNMLSPSEELDDELSGNLDAYYQKASEDFGFCYEEYLPAVIRWIKPEGFLIFNPYNQSGDCIIPYNLLSGFEWKISTKIKLGATQDLGIAAGLKFLKAVSHGHGWAMVALQKLSGTVDNMRVASPVRLDKIKPVDFYLKPHSFESNRLYEAIGIKRLHILIHGARVLPRSTESLEKAIVDLSYDELLNLFWILGLWSAAAIVVPAGGQIINLILTLCFFSLPSFYWVLYDRYMRLKIYRLLQIIEIDPIPSLAQEGVAGSSPLDRENRSSPIVKSGLSIAKDFLGNEVVGKVVKHWMEESLCANNTRHEIAAVLLWLSDYILVDLRGHLSSKEEELLDISKMFELSLCLEEILWPQVEKKYPYTLKQFISNMENMFFHRSRFSDKGGLLLEYVNMWVGLFTSMGSNLIPALCENMDKVKENSASSAALFSRNADSGKEHLRNYPKIIIGTEEDLKVGALPVYEKCVGLEYCVYIPELASFVGDNHSEQFLMIKLAYELGLIKGKGKTLIHVDRPNHSDLNGARLREYDINGDFSECIRYQKILNENIHAGVQGHIVPLVYDGTISHIVHVINDQRFGEDKIETIQHTVLHEFIGEGLPYMTGFTGAHAIYCANDDDYAYRIPVSLTRIHLSKLENYLQNNIPRPDRILGMDIDSYIGPQIYGEKINEKAFSFWKSINLLFPAIFMFTSPYYADQKQAVDFCRDILNSRRAAFEQGASSLVSSAIGYSRLSANWRNKMLRYLSEAHDLRNMFDGNLRMIKNRYRRVKGVGEENKIEAFIFPVRRAIEEYFAYLRKIIKEFCSAKDYEQIRPVLQAKRRDIKNKLTLLRKYLLEEGLKESIESVDILRDILSSNPRAKRVDLRKALQQIVTRFAELYESAMRIEFQDASGRGNTGISANMSVLARIFDNLIRNSNKAFNENELLPKEKRMVRVAFHSVKNGYLIIYDCNGPGIHKGAGDIFKRSVTTREIKQEGEKPFKGLGLSITKFIVYKLGGLISKSNKPNKKGKPEEGGVIFTIFLPRTTRHSGQQAITRLERLTKKQVFLEGLRKEISASSLEGNNNAVFCRMFKDKLSRVMPYIFGILGFIIIPITISVFISLFNILLTFKSGGFLPVIASIISDTFRILFWWCVFSLSLPVFRVARRFIVSGQASIIYPLNEIMENAGRINIQDSEIYDLIISSSDLWQLFIKLKEKRLINAGAGYDTVKFRNFAIKLLYTVRPSANPEFPASKYGENYGMTSLLLKTENTDFHVIGIMHGTEFMPMSVDKVQALVSELSLNNISLYSEDNFQLCYGYKHGVNIDDHKIDEHLTLLCASLAKIIIFAPIYVLLGACHYIFSKNETDEYLADIRPGYLADSRSYHRSQYMARYAFSHSGTDKDIVLLVGLAHMYQAARELGELAKNPGQDNRNFDDFSASSAFSPSSPKKIYIPFSFLSDDFELESILRGCFLSKTPPVFFGFLIGYLSFQAYHFGILTAITKASGYYWFFKMVLSVTGLQYYTRLLARNINEDYKGGEELVSQYLLEMNQDSRFSYKYCEPVAVGYSVKGVCIYFKEPYLLKAIAPIFYLLPYWIEPLAGWRPFRDRLKEKFFKWAQKSKTSPEPIGFSLRQDTDRSGSSLTHDFFRLQKRIEAAIRPYGAQDADWAGFKSVIREIKKTDGLKAIVFSNQEKTDIEIDHLCGKEDRAIEFLHAVQYKFGLTYDEFGMHLPWFLAIGMENVNQHVTDGIGVCLISNLRNGYYSVSIIDNGEDFIDKWGRKISIKRAIQFGARLSKNSKEGKGLHYAICDRAKVTVIEKPGRSAIIIPRRDADFNIFPFYKKGTRNNRVFGTTITGFIEARSKDGFIPIDELIIDIDKELRLKAQGKKINESSSPLDETKKRLKAALLSDRPDQELRNMLPELLLEHFSSDDKAMSESITGHLYKVDYPVFGNKEPAYDYRDLLRRGIGIKLIRANPEIINSVSSLQEFYELVKNNSIYFKSLMRKMLVKGYLGLPRTIFIKFEKEDMRICAADFFAFEFIFSLHYLSIFIAKGLAEIKIVDEEETWHGVYHAKAYKTSKSGFGLEVALRGVRYETGFPKPASPDDVAYYLLKEIADYPTRFPLDSMALPEFTSPQELVHKFPELLERACISLAQDEDPENRKLAANLWFIPDKVLRPMLADRYSKTSHYAAETLSIDRSLRALAKEIAAIIAQNISADLLKYEGKISLERYIINNLAPLFININIFIAALWYENKIAGGAGSVGAFIRNTQSIIVPVLLMASRNGITEFSETLLALMRKVSFFKGEHIGWHTSVSGGSRWLDDVECSGRHLVKVNHCLPEVTQRLEDLLEHFSRYYSYFKNWEADYRAARRENMMREAGYFWDMVAAEDFYIPFNKEYWEDALRRFESSFHGRYGNEFFEETFGRNFLEQLAKKIEEMSHNQRRPFSEFFGFHGREQGVSKYDSNMSKAEALEVLGLSEEGLTKKGIKKAFYRKAREYHTDRREEEIAARPDLKKELEKKFRRCSEARAKLEDCLSASSSASSEIISSQIGELLYLLKHSKEKILGIRLPAEEVESAKSLLEEKLSVISNVELIAIIGGPGEAVMKFKEIVESAREVKIVIMSVFRKELPKMGLNSLFSADLTDTIAYQIEKLANYIPATSTEEYDGIRDLSGLLKSLKPYQQLRILNIPEEVYTSDAFYLAILSAAGDSEINFGRIKSGNIWYFTKSRGAKEGSESRILFNTLSSERILPLTADLGKPDWANYNKRITAMLVNTGHTHPGVVSKNKSVTGGWKVCLPSIGDLLHLAHNQSLLNTTVEHLILGSQEAAHITYNGNKEMRLLLNEYLRLNKGGGSMFGPRLPGILADLSVCYFDRGPERYLHLIRELGFDIEFRFLSDAASREPGSASPLGLGRILGEFDQVESNLIANRLLTENFVGYAKIMRLILNPNSRDMVIGYGCAGADISNLWVATHFARAYFINNINVNIKTLERHHNKWPDLAVNSAYFHEKFYLGRNFTDDFIGDIEYYIIQELKAMGAARNRIHITRDYLGRPKLIFFLPKDDKAREVIFINHNLLDNNSAFNRELNLSLDGYYQKASEYLLKQHETFIPYISGWIKPKGFLALNCYTPDSEYIDPRPLIRGTFEPVTDELYFPKIIISMLVAGAASAGRYGVEIEAWEKMSASSSAKSSIVDMVQLLMRAKEFKSAGQLDSAMISRLNNGQPVNMILDVGSGEGAYLLNRHSLAMGKRENLLLVGVEPDSYMFSRASLRITENGLPNILIFNMPAEHLPHGLKFNEIVILAPEVESREHPVVGLLGGIAYAKDMLNRGLGDKIGALLSENGIVKVITEVHWLYFGWQNTSARIPNGSSYSDFIDGLEARGLRKLCVGFVNAKEVFRDLCIEGTYLHRQGFPLLTLIEYGKSASPLKVLSKIRRIFGKVAHRIIKINSQEQERIGMIGVRIIKAANEKYPGFDGRKVGFIVYKDSKDVPCVAFGRTITMGDWWTLNFSGGESAFCIGHEVSHIAKKFSLDKLSVITPYVICVIALALKHLLPGVSAFSIFIGMISIIILFNILFRYLHKRNELARESLCDREGVILLVKAGYNARDAVSFFEKMVNSEREPGNVLLTRFALLKDFIAALKNASDSRSSSPLDKEAPETVFAQNRLEGIGRKIVAAARVIYPFTSGINFNFSVLKSSKDIPWANLGHGREFSIAIGDYWMDKLRDDEIAFILGFRVAAVFIFILRLKDIKLSEKYIKYLKYSEHFPLVFIFITLVLGSIKFPGILTVLVIFGLFRLCMSINKFFLGSEISRVQSFPDEMAIGLVNKAGYSPDGIISVLKKLFPEENELGFRKRLDLAKKSVSELDIVILTAWRKIARVVDLDRLRKIDVPEFADILGVQKIIRLPSGSLRGSHRGLIMRNMNKWSKSDCMHELLQLTADNLDKTDDSLEGVLNDKHFCVLEGELRFASLLGKEELGRSRNNMEKRLVVLWDMLIKEAFEDNYDKEKLARLWEMRIAIEDLLSNSYTNEFSKASLAIWEKAAQTNSPIIKLSGASSILSLEEVVKRLNEIPARQSPCGAMVSLTVKIVGRNKAMRLTGTAGKYLFTVPQGKDVLKMMDYLEKELRGSLLLPHVKLIRDELSQANKQNLRNLKSGSPLKNKNVCSESKLKEAEKAVLLGKRGSSNEAILHATGIILDYTRRYPQSISANTLTALNRVISSEWLLRHDESINEVYLNALEAIDQIIEKRLDLISQEELKKLAFFLLPYEHEELLSIELHKIGAGLIYKIGIKKNELLMDSLASLESVLLREPINGRSMPTVIYDNLTRLSNDSLRPQDANAYKIWLWFRSGIPFVYALSWAFEKLYKEYKNAAVPEKYLQNLWQKAGKIIQDKINRDDNDALYLAYLGIRVLGGKEIDYWQFSRCLEIQDLTQDTKTKAQLAVSEKVNILTPAEIADTLLAGRIPQIYSQEAFSAFKEGQALSVHLGMIEKEHEALRKIIDCGGQAVFLEHSDRYMELNKIITLTHYHLLHMILPFDSLEYARAKDILQIISDKNNISSGYPLLIIKEFKNFIGDNATAEIGYITVESRLADNALNDSELAAVIAHEIAHCENEDCRKGIEFTCLHGSPKDENKALWESYSQGKELEADRLAVHYLHNAGYNCFALVTALIKLRKINHVDLRNGKDVIKPKFRYKSHPDLRERFIVIAREVKFLKNEPKNKACSSPQKAEWVDILLKSKNYVSVSKVLEWLCQEYYKRAREIDKETPLAFFAAGTYAELFIELRDNCGLNGKNILEVGPGWAAFIYALQEYSKRAKMDLNIIGVEIDKHKTIFAKEVGGINVVSADINDFSFDAKNEFDCVISRRPYLDISYPADNMAYLSSCYNIVAPGGWCIIESDLNKYSHYSLDYMCSLCQEIGFETKTKTARLSLAPILIMRKIEHSQGIRNLGPGITTCASPLTAGTGTCTDGGLAATNFMRYKNARP